MRIFGGEFKGRKLKAPKKETTRPTKGIVREALFNLCQGSLQDARFLDLFAGSGSMGFEALSRGASAVVFVEQDRTALNSIRENIQLLNVEKRAEWISGSALSALNQLEQRGFSFDLIYIDPPYEKTVELVTPILHQIEQTTLLAPGGMIFLEASSRGKPLAIPCKELQIQQVRVFGNTRLYLYWRQGRKIYEEKQG